ncbi:MAG: hypothetical protein HOQ02_07530 [Lysobacter sp.]|nr:hypothetical protein [Lysobacter sp.]
MHRDAIVVPGLPPLAPFSPAVRAPCQGSRLVYLSGQVGLDPGTGKLVDGGFEREVEQALRNMAAVLDAAGLGFDDVIKVNVYLARMDDFARFNAIYACHFRAPYPAGTTIAVAGLPLGASVEMEAIAAGPAGATAGP